MALTLYGRKHCHLCHEMADGLTAMGLVFEWIDIDTDPALKTRYDWDVPVLVGAGREICRHFFDPVAVRDHLGR